MHTEGSSANQFKIRNIRGSDFVSGSAFDSASGFALVATVAVMALLLMVALALVSLSTLEVRASRNDTHQSQARANARLALMLALGELQQHTGSDQRVSARAAILESGSNTIANRNWVGVWSTTYESSGKQWPVIGKQVGSSAGNPYTRKGAYEDLRHTNASLSGDNWKNKLLKTWLVSGLSNSINERTALSLSDDQVIEIVGRGTLGGGMRTADFQKNQVLIPKVNTSNGGYAWYVSDNSQKASIDPLSSVSLTDAAYEASPRDNPALISLSGQQPYTKFTHDGINHPGRFLTYGTAPLTQQDRSATQSALAEHYHHLTNYSPGLFVNTLTGGLKQDLTPLLLTKKQENTVSFSDSRGATTRQFSSSYPIIPGAEHGVLGPSFGALRDWALHTHSDLTDAETSFPSDAVRTRPTSFWPHNISDGAAADASTWAEKAPKIHPVMTDSRWHYYFSHHNKRIRTHIVPRVCLWNPYNRALKTSALTVLMPNPFYNLSHGMHFFPEEDHVNQLKQNHSSNSSHVFSRWIKKSGYVGGSVYKMRTNPFPNVRYLAFTLEGTTLAAGECQVFSPMVTNASLQSSGVRLQKYEPTAVGQNILSPSSPQGMDHYYYDHAASVRYQVQASNWRSLSSTDLNEIDFNRIFDYQPEVSMQSDGKVENFPFALKVGSASSLTSLYTGTAHPTLQLINNGAGGAKPTTYFGYIGQTWGSANQQDNSFGNLQTFADAPLKDAPDTHQVGAKLLWLDESGTEANSPPLRVDRWTNDHMVYNVSPIANWNVRAQMTTRSPSSQCALKWYMTGAGSWLLQFVPHSPQDINDQPSLSPSGNTFIKNPFGAANHFPFHRNVVLFDLPSRQYGVLSIAKLRHAMLSPYSWNPSYLVGHSLRDMHAPADFTAHAVAVDTYSGGRAPTRWDYLIGGAKGSGLSHGPYAKQIDSQGLLQIGNQGVTRGVAGTNLSSSDEVLAYDIAYEVNHNLWDSYFFSGMPVSSDTSTFSWDNSSISSLWNQRYAFNFSQPVSQDKASDLLNAADGANVGFWRNAEFFKNRAAFNVNSTSVEAWTAFLSGNLGVARTLASGNFAGDEVSFARHAKPTELAETNDANPDKAGAWRGGRKLTHDEIRLLASNIVDQVRARGPFISLADFVNRRLTSEGDETSKMGTIEAAIAASQFNKNFELNNKYLSTAVNVGTRTDAPDNNLSTFKNSYRYRENGSYTTVQPVSQAWGLPGFLTQGDVLEPLAPALTVRGDTFTIRAYGESKQDGKIMAKAWVEAVVERSPEYVDSSNSGNKAIDSPMTLDYATGALRSDDLKALNAKFGRRYILKSIRWLSPDEV